MPVCPKCGAFSDDIKIFCPECGRKFDKPSDGTEQKNGQYDWQNRYQQYRRDYGEKYPQYKQQAEHKENGANNASQTQNAGAAAGKASLVLSIISFALCFFPAFSIAGLITGIVGLKKRKTKTAKVGLILSAISLAIFIAALVITGINGFNYADFTQQVKNSVNSIT